MGLTMQDFAMFMEMGTGKTRTMIEILRRRYGVQKRVMRTLILAPKIVLRNWKHEFSIFSKINPKDIIILDKSGKRRAKDLYDAVFDGSSLSKGKIVITNYEAMEMESLVQCLTDWSPEILVCDEAHRLKSHESVRAKIVAKLSDLALHVYLLTGTPILNGATDVFNQYRILDGGETFGNNFFAFRNRYFQDENSQWSGKPGHFHKWVARPETYEHLHKLMYKKAIRAVKSECLDLPPMVRQTIDVELSPEQTKMYKEMAKEFVTYVRDEQAKGTAAAVVAQLAITKMLRLQQIVSGFAKDTEGNHHRLPCPRLQVLAEQLREITPTHKVIVWAIFKENYAMITELLTSMKIGFAELHGGVPHKDREEMVRKFRKDENIRVMVANQGAGGIGINLTEASYSLYFSRGPSLEQDLQSEARNYRGGSEIHKSVTRIDLIAPDTTDELIALALSKKQDIATQILDWEIL